MVLKFEPNRKKPLTMREIVSAYRTNIGAYKFNLDRYQRMAKNCLKEKRYELAKRYAERAKESCNLIIAYSLDKEERARYRKIRKELLNIIRVEAVVNAIQGSDNND